jgi:hypothetical protein
MARQESDRDDLFAELAALSPRVELAVGSSPESVCAGRRESTGGWSVFFGPDRVYHFDASGRLRRAYLEGFLYRSEGLTLSRLRRERSATETSLLRHDLDAAELQGLLAAMRSTIRGFLEEIHSNRVHVSRVLPEHEEILSPLAAVLERAMDAKPPLAPAIRG